MRWYGLIFSIVLIKFCFCNEDYRLPPIKPSHYDIKFITHLNDSTTPFKFAGEVVITLIPGENTNKIVLHSKGLKIFEDQVTLQDKTGNTLSVSKQYGGNYDLYTIEFNETLSKTNEYKLSMKYEGKLTDSLLGYYRSSFVDRATGETKWLALTQFEPVAARNAFPCFDEPALKAVFKITMGHKKKYNALSNMPLKQTLPMIGEPDWIWDEFEESVVMSTYLVAFVLSDFESKTSEGNLFKTWARKDALEQVNYAREFGPKALNFFENYFSIKYPLPKMDQIAIPDFNAGAMENWGLITYRETTLLYDVHLSSMKDKARVANVISHELAHQWFGNLVTMKWWTDLWLNEGFATYMASIAVENLSPDWQQLDQDITNNLLLVFALDSLNSSHPISVPIGNPEKISEIFDTISYKKGFFIIHMMTQFLSEDVLRKGVSNYLNKYKYSNAVQDDLWESLTEEAHKQGTLPKNTTVKQIMDSWTLDTGYPVVTIKRDCENSKVTFSQERFLQRNIQNIRDTDSCWMVPISYTTNTEKDFNNTRPKLWLSCEEKEKTIHLKCDDWILANIHASGLYIVNYDEQNWKNIIKTLKSSNYKEISTMNRVLLIDNVLSLARTGHVSYDIAFDLLSYLKQEEEYLPWNAAIINMYDLDKLLATTSIYGEFKNFVKTIITPIYNKLLNEGKAEEEPRNFKQSVANLACDFDVENCVNTAKQHFHEWRTGDNKTNKIPPHLWPAYYCAAIRHGNEEDWDFLWNKYTKSNVDTEKSTILSSLGCSKETWILSRYLEWILTDSSGIRKQNILSVYASVVHSNDGYLLGKRFLKDKINAVHTRVAPIYNRMGSYFKILAGHIVMETEEKELKQFYDDNKDKFSSAKLSIDQALETMSLNVAWYKKNKSNILNVLQCLKKSVSV